jgi:DNA-binding NarL/FixJ family response regulator
MPATRPDVVLIRADGDEASTLLGRVRAVDGRVPVLVETGGHGGPTIGSVVAAGGSGIVCSSRGPLAIREAIVRTRSGELVLEDEELRSLVDELVGTRDDRRRGPEGLTTREREVLKAVAAGASTNEIAADLHITPATVQSHVKNVLMKLGVHSKVEAVRIAWREGIAPVPA